MTQTPTSDDEAFIRAIVAAPGDDAPRLVYADWLDERGDSRGAFLRAEVEFVHAHGGELSKKEFSVWATRWKKIDPVWAARVSRPPVGICSTEVRFTHSGPPTDGETLDRIQLKLQAKLPPAYRAFLMNCNGGIPDPKRLTAAAHSPPELVLRFYPAVEESAPPGPSQRYWGDWIQATNALYASRFVPRGPRRMIPILAATYPVSYLIGTVGARLGGIYRCADVQLEGGLGPSKVADSLPVFLMRLREQS